MTEINEKLSALISEGKPIDIEVGFGKGRFIIDKAKTYKDVNFIGFEVKAGLVEKVIGLIEKFQLENIYVEKSYANISIPEKIPPASVRNVYINFPDPWWKKRHHKRRILKKEFIDLFYNILKIDGMIYVRTDVKDYADMTRENFSEIDSFVEVEHDIISDGIITDRERRIKEEGLDIYYLAFRKIK